MSTFEELVEEGAAAPVELRALHERIQAEGKFVAWSRRFLIEAVKPR